jgi:tetratricopeptide (TPR) repeat protein
LLLAVVGSLTALPAPVRAQHEEGRGDVAAPEQDADLARRAREEFQAGLQHFRARRFREAMHSFHVAAQLVPSADLWFNIARAHEELAEWEQAIEYYRRYLRDRVDPPDRERVEARIAELEERAEAARSSRLQLPTTGSLVVSVDVTGASVTLDGRAVGTTPLSDALSLSPGRHALLVERAGYVPVRSEVQIDAGLRTAAYVDLRPETRYRAIVHDRVFTWVAFGLAAAAVGVSIGLGVEASSRQGGDFASALEWSSYSDAMLGAAIGFGVLGIILWFVEGRSVGTETISAPDEGASAATR